MKFAVTSHWVALAVTLVLPAAATAPAVASEPFPATAWQDKPSTRVRLVGGAERHLSAGVVRMAGIEIDLAPGWKTYWRNPGDAGVPPSIDWSKSENVEDIQLRFPAPTRIKDRGGTTIGYAQGVTLPLMVKPKDDTKPATVIVEVAYGICKDICVPVEANLKLTLPPNLGPQNEAPAIAAAYARLPRYVGQVASGVPTSGIPSVQSVSAIWVGDGAKLSLNARGAEDAYVEAPDGEFLPLAQSTGPDASGRGTIFEVDLSKVPDAEALRGKKLRITLVGSAGAIEADWLAK